MNFLKSLIRCLLLACFLLCLCGLDMRSATAQPPSPTTAELNVRLTALEAKVASQDQKLDAILTAVKSLSPQPVVVPAPVLNSPLSSLTYTASAGGCGQSVTYSSAAGACGTASVDASASGCGAASGTRKRFHLLPLFGQRHFR